MSEEKTIEEGNSLPQPLGSDACQICGAELKWGITHRGRRIGSCRKHGFVRLYASPLEREKVGLIRRFLSKAW